MKTHPATRAISVGLTTLSGAILGGLVAGKPGAIGAAVAGAGTGLALQFEEERNCHVPIAVEVAPIEFGLVVGAGMGAGAGWALGHPKAGAVVGTALGLVGGFVLAFLGGASGSKYCGAKTMPLPPSQQPIPKPAPGSGVVAGFGVYR